jgi:hypothetical protein
MISPTGALNTVEVPQSPCRMPQKRGASAGSVPGAMQRPRDRPSFGAVQPGRTPSHSP